MLKHTPGPWGCTHELNEVAFVQIPKGSNNLVCLPGGIRDPEHLPNARLITAAPDMLELLLEMSSVDDLNDFAVEIDAMIQKATG